VPPSPARAPVAGPSPTNAVGRRRASRRRPLVPAAAGSCRPPPARAVAVAGSCRPPPARAGRRRIVPLPSQAHAAAAGSCPSAG